MGIPMRLITRPRIFLLAYINWVLSFITPHIPLSTPLIRTNEDPEWGYTQFTRKP